MAIYNGGSEAEVFETAAGNSFAQSTQAGTFEANLSRGAMLVTRAVSEIIMPFKQTLTDVWVHFHLYQEDVEALDSYIIFEDASQTTPAYRIDVSVAGNWSVLKYKSGAWSAALATSAAPVLVNGSADIDIHINRHLTTGSIDIYKDGVSVLSYSGDTDTDIAPASVHFRGLTTNAREMFVSQVIVADVDTKGWKLQTHSPDGAGTNGSWTNDYTAVDEFVYDPNDYIETNTANQLETMNVTDINAAYSTYNVQAVIVGSRNANDAGSAVADVQMVVRTGGTDYSSPNAGLVKDGSDKSVTHVWETNPNTSSAWTQAEVNGLEAGVKSV